MNAISTWLYNESGFRYPPVYGGKIVSMATEPIHPYWIAKRWDSMTSPAALSDIARRIGGFEDIRSCYYDYPYGSTEWYAWHYYMTANYNGEAGFYMVCPDTSTGKLDAIDYVDFSRVGDFQKL